MTDDELAVMGEQGGSLDGGLGEAQAAVAQVGEAGDRRVAIGFFEPAGGDVRDVCGLGVQKWTGKSVDYAKPAVEELAAHVAKVKRTRNITLRRKNGCLWVRNTDS